MKELGELVLASLTLAAIFEWLQAFARLVVTMRQAKDPGKRGRVR